MKKHKTSDLKLIGVMVNKWDEMQDNSLRNFNEFFTENLTGNPEDEVTILEPFTDNGRIIKIGDGKPFAHVFTNDSQKFISYEVRDLLTGEIMPRENLTELMKEFKVPEKLLYQHYKDREPLHGRYIIHKIKISSKSEYELKRGYNNNQNWVNNLNPIHTQKKLESCYQ